jgi:hypothetical protein
MVLQEVEKQPGKGNHILPVVFYDRYQRPAITGAEIGFIEFRDHLPGNIIGTMNTQDLFLKRG